MSRHRLGTNPSHPDHHTIEGEFVMPRFVSKDGKHTTETSNPVERISLLRQGYAEQKARTQAVKAADQQAAKATGTTSK